MNSKFLVYIEDISRTEPIAILESNKENEEKYEDLKQQLVFFIENKNSKMTNYNIDINNICIKEVPSVTYNNKGELEQGLSEIINRHLGEKLVSKLTEEELEIVKMIVRE